MKLFARLAVIAAILILPGSAVAAETPMSLERQLVQEGAASLVAAARRQGDAQRGAIVFYQRGLGCATCHAPDAGRPAIGPDLSQAAADHAHDGHADPNDAAAYLVEAVLEPAKSIRKGFETLQIVTDEGRNITGLLAEDRPDELVLREASGDFALIRIAKSSIDERQVRPVSLMPSGLVNQLAGREQFLDLLRYLLEIFEHGPLRARQLRPPPGFYEMPPPPEYEQHVDHAGLLAGLDEASFRRGEVIYRRLCINCHGTRDEAGSLPASLRFASGTFRHGSDPYSIYQTLTRGFGLMPPQTWMVPRQKYDVIHYVREAYLKPHNPSQYVAIDADYLAGLPRGDTFGPEPTSFEPWAAADYGPSLINTYEVGSDGGNFAYKGIAVRLDAGQGGVSKGNDWLVFDHDTLRMAAIWSYRPDQEGRFIDFNGIHFNGRHQTHPRIVGQLRAANRGLGWANPNSGDAPHGDFNDPRLRGRDNKPYGPLPRDWGRFRGLYHHGRQTVISYTVGQTDVLELPGMARDVVETGSPLFTRTFNIGPRPRDLVLQGADYASKAARLRVASRPDGSRTAIVERDPSAANQEESPLFAGEQSWEPANPQDFDVTNSDYTIAARIRTVDGGAIFCQTQPGEQWVPDGKVFFVRGGRLCFDIGWVGVVESRRKVDDGQWHDVAVRWRRKSAEAALFIDGRPDRQEVLRPAGRLKSPIVRLGFGAPDFPQPRSYFKGDIDEVRFYQRGLSDQKLAAWPAAGDDDSLVARWRPDQAKDNALPDLVSHQHDAKLATDPAANAHDIRAGLVPDVSGAEWLLSEGHLRLRLPAGEEPLRTTLWMSDAADDRAIETAAISEPIDLASLTRGGPARWPEELRTKAVIGADDGPFAVDLLTHPTSNPWSCQMRFTGLDFSADGQTAFVSTWDGDVWRVTGVDHPEQGLSWRRIASGLFQPLGLKIVGGQIYVGCRDQIVRLHDLNGDGETDFYETFNSDHQVTEHFHEFAMGLQTDAAGNFYYAKSARHGLPAIVPHHGTLLRVSGDGRCTDIIATGFRAANGVCVNPDGTFLVTDQEGHWTPKNRINWVEPGGFYGNMFGYHDVSDTADDQMRQPLCWVTNAFDRSPGELLWVTSDAWRPLTGSLLELSYGAGKIFIVPHERIAGQWQGGLATLPLPIFPTGVMRGRFHPLNGQLYACGMFAWAGNQTAPGGLYRVRYTGKPVYAPVELHARRGGVEIKFSGRLAPETAEDAKRFTVRAWSLKRTADYGSAHHDERQLAVASATLAGDDQTVFLELPDLRPTWCMSIEYALRTADGTPVVGEINNTIHHLSDD